MYSVIFAEFAMPYHYLRRFMGESITLCGVHSTILYHLYAKH
jgi:hypothetical protein